MSNKTSYQSPNNTNSSTTMPFQQHSDLYNFWATSTSGGIANAISRTVVAPFERARLQMSVDSHYKSMLHCMKTLYANEGLYGFWRGNILNVLRIYPQGAISFLLKDTAQIFYPKWFRDSSLSNPTSAMIAGGISMTLVYPLDYVRVRVTTLPGLYPNWYEGLKIMYRQGGLNSLYEGLKYSNYWAMLYYGVQFTIYDQLKALYLSLSNQTKMDPLTGLLFGSLSGIVCMTTAYPLEAIRRRLQVQGVGNRPIEYTGVRDCARQIIQKNGWRGLFKGLSANMVKTPLSIGVTFACYETLMAKVFQTQMKKI